MPYKQALVVGEPLADNRSDGYFSGDYRLSPYGALSWRLRP